MSRDGARPAAVSWGASTAVGCAAFAVYLALAPTVAGDRDASELTLVLATNGVTHPTGYPLYTLFGALFVRGLHALGAGWAYAANAWSALGGGVCIALLHGFAVRLVPADAPLAGRGRFLAALFPVALFATNPIWTSQTTLAEVYSWHLAWVCGAAVCFARFAAELGSAPPPDASRRHRMAVLWGLLCGAGGAHHLTAILVAAPLCFGLAWIAWRRQSLHAGDALRVVAAAGLPLLAYGAIAMRAFHPTGVQWPLLGASWSSVFDHVTGRLYRVYLGHYAPSLEQRHHLAAFVYPLLALGVAALATATALARAQASRATLVALGLAALLCTAYAFGYGVSDPAPYFLAPLALGLAALAPLGVGLATSGRIGPRVVLGGIVVATLVMAVVAVRGLAVARARRQVYENFETLVRGMWRSIPYDRGMVLWPDDMYARLLAYQLLDGEKPQIEVIDPFILANDLPRSRFVTQHGFDPMQGVTSGSGRERPAGDPVREAFLRDVSENLNRHTALPVVWFDPRNRSVRMLRKPAHAGVDSATAP